MKLTEYKIPKQPGMSNLSASILNCRLLQSREVLKLDSSIIKSMIQEETQRIQEKNGGFCFSSAVVQNQESERFSLNNR